MPDNTSASPDPATPPSGAWDLIAVPSHLDEHIPDFPVPTGTVATISMPLPEKGGTGGAPAG